MHLQKNRQSSFLRWHSPQSINTKQALHCYKIKNNNQVSGHETEFKTWLPTNLLIVQKLVSP